MTSTRLTTYAENKRTSHQALGLMMHEDAVTHAICCSEAEKGHTVSCHLYLDKLSNTMPLSAAQQTTCLSTHPCHKSSDNTWANVTLVNTAATRAVDRPAVGRLGLFYNIKHQHPEHVPYHITNKYNM